MPGEPVRLASPRKPWTEHERSYLRENAFRLSCEQMAQDLGRSLSSIHSQCCRLGLIVRPNWSEEEKATLQKLLPTLSLKEVALAVGRSPNAVRQQAQKMRLPVSTSVLFKRRRARVAS